MKATNFSRLSGGLVVILLVTGCSSSPSTERSTQEITGRTNRTTSDTVEKAKRLAIAKENLGLAKYWLSENQDILSDGRCSLATAKPVPATACKPSEAEDKAIAICAIPMGGCEVARHYADSGMQSFLTSQACGALVAELKGDSYELKDAFETFFMDGADRAADNMLHQGGLVATIVGIGLKSYTISKKMEEFSDCVYSVQHKCTKIFTDWEAKERENQDRVEKCHAVMQDATRYEAEIAQLSASNTPVVNDNAPTIRSLGSPGTSGVVNSGSATTGNATQPSSTHSNCLPESPGSLNLQTLISNSESMKAEERKYWTGVLPVMTASQTEELRDILETERRKLRDIDCR